MSLKTAELKFKILKIVRKADCYGYEIHKVLVSQGVKIDLGRLYKVLTEMSIDEELVYRWLKSSRGPDKRVYTLGEKGKVELGLILRKAIETIHESYVEYLLSLPTRISIFEAFAKMVAPEIQENCKFIFLSKNPSPVHESILTALYDRSRKSEYYIIYPKEVIFENKIENFVYLHGDYDNIPLREKYADLLVIEGFPEIHNLSKAVGEWYRVIKEGGRLVIIAPTAVFSALKDPLSIGDFVEKMEHSQNRRIEPGQGEALTTLLQSHFARVERKQMLQMTVVIAY